MARLDSPERVLVDTELFEDHVLLTYPPSEHAPGGNRVIVPAAPIWSEAELLEMAERTAVRQRIINRLGPLGLKQLLAMERQINETLVSDGEQG